MLKKTSLLLLTITTFLFADPGYPGFDFEHEHHEFKVFANGEEMPVAHVAQFAFSSFTLDAPVFIKIETAHDLRWVDIRPKNEAIDFDYSENTIEFELTEPKKLSIELNGENSYPLYIFANEPKNYIRDKNTIVFEGGKLHQPGKIEIKSGQTVLLEAGAVVRGYIEAEDLENIKIVGEGIFDGSEFSKENRLFKHRIIQLNHCKNVLIDGIMIVNSATWTIEPMFCENVEIRDIKMMNWRFGSDGIDLVGCQDITIDNSFIRANDDCVVLKTWGGREKYPQEPIDGPNVSNINVINSIFWNMAWGNALEIGFELRAQKIENVRFENCDIIAVDRGAVFSIHNGDYCTVQDITYKDIRVENANHKLIDLAIFVSQYSVDHQGEKSERAKYYLHGAWDGVQKVMPGNEEKIAKGRGHIKNITFENIAILDGKLPFSVIAGFNKEHQVEDVTIKNLSFYGQPLKSLNAAKIDTVFTKNIRVK